MLTNLITSLFIAFGVGASSFNSEHIINAKADSVDMSTTIYKYSDSEKFFNQYSKFYLKDIDFNDSNTIYLLPSFDDLMNSFYGSSNIGYSKKVPFNFKRQSSNVYDVVYLYFDISTSDSDYALMAEIPNGSRLVIYILDSNFNYQYSGFFEGLNIMGNQYPSYDISSCYYEKQSGDLFNDNLGLILFYFSQYSFNGGQVYVKNTIPISLFYSDYYNPLVSTTNWNSELNPIVKVMYRGWFEVGGVYYNQMVAQFTSTSDKIFSTSNDSTTIFLTDKVMLWEITFRNTFENYGLHAYQPFYDVESHPIETTSGTTLVTTYIFDSYTDAWRIDYINFLSIGCSGSPGYSTSYSSLGYFVPLTQLGELSNNLNYVDLGQSFNLISLAFKGIADFLNIKILPFLNIGTLLLIPLIFVIVFAVVKMFKR